MNIKIAQKNNFKDFIGFRGKLLRGDNSYRDMHSRILKALLYGRSCLVQSIRFKPVMVVEDEILLGVCLFAVVDRMKDTLQMAFLDFVDDGRVLRLLLDYAKMEAKKQGLVKVLIGLNLHVNYGLGILADSQDKVQDLASAYHPKYYTQQIERLAKASEELVSYQAEMSAIDLSLPLKAKASIYEKFHVKTADFHNIKQTAAIYNQVNNRAFAHHKYYFERRSEEDLELFMEFKPLLREENLLFVFYKEEPVGFLLWYPDFNQLIGPGEELGPAAVLKYRLGWQKIDTMILTEIGVIPAFQYRGAVYALLDSCHQRVKDRYRHVVTSWIMKDNAGSIGISERFIKQVYKRYKVFEIKV